MTRSTIFKRALVWVAAFLLYGPAIIGWEYVAKSSILPQGECYAEFFYNWYFLMTTSIIEFFTAFISVTYFNLSIYTNIRKCTSLRKANAGPSHDGLEMDFQRRQNKHIIFFKSAERISRKRKDWDISHMHKGSSLVVCGTQDLPPLQVDHGMRATQRWQNHYRADKVCNAPGQLDLRSTRASCLRLSRDKRVAKSLAIIVCVFSLCWAPYTLLMIIRAACHGTCIQLSLYDILLAPLVELSYQPCPVSTVPCEFQKSIHQTAVPWEGQDPPSYVRVTDTPPGPDHLNLLFSESQ